MLLNIEDQEKIRQDGGDGDFFAEEFLMDDRPVPPNSSDPQLDEAVWNAWVKKNEIKDKIQFARRKKILGVVLVLGVVVLLVWRCTP
jgi:hypothetical protein